MPKPATIFTATGDGDFAAQQLCGRETRADVEARQARRERRKIGLFCLVAGIALMAEYCGIALAAGAFD
jgi:hypothetical protein